MITRVWSTQPDDTEYVRRAAMYWNAYQHHFTIRGDTPFTRKLYDNYIFWFIAASCGKDYAIKYYMP